MELADLIRGLDGAPITKHSEDAWIPTGPLGVENLEVSTSEGGFDLLVPTESNDFWDYILTSERDSGTTSKVRLFQHDNPLAGSAITAVSRESEDSRFQFQPGPEQYRLRFVLRVDSVDAEAPIEARFFWQDDLMASAVGRE